MQVGHKKDKVSRVNEKRAFRSIDCEFKRRIGPIPFRYARARKLISEESVNGDLSLLFSGDRRWIDWTAY